MARPIERIVIVGGGTAGWLSACYLAARLSTSPRPVSIALIESPDIPTIGVGEGTWPTMRGTLATIGLDEAEFLAGCDGSFKQGSRFDGWATGDPGDSYLHPFTPPPAMPPADLVSYWKAQSDISFAETVTAQAAVCGKDLAPRQPAMPPYAGALNYAYHLDAGKFAALLRTHGTARLGVRHVSDEVVGVERDGDHIEAVLTKSGDRIEGDLFLDCSGHRALLIGQQLGSGWIDASPHLFNDRALAAQVPVEPGSPIASQTIGTAHDAGWIWDIGLPSRRGIGCVYSSRFMDDDQAEAVLRDYIRTVLGDEAAASTAARRLLFPTGYRERFWIGNCIAVGLSAGFVEPLEASAIVTAELSLSALADNFPQSTATLPILARRFDELFRTRWERIVDFLKLHYVLSERDQPYWQAHRDPLTRSERLADLLALWRDQPPSDYDLPMIEEMFPAASHQYVYYGMTGRAFAPSGPARSDASLDAVAPRARSLVAALPTNRVYLDDLQRRAPDRKAH